MPHAVDDLPAVVSAVHSNDESSSTAPRRAFHIFGQSGKVHDILGGGKTADVLLWREKHLSAGILAGATIAWILFYWLQYTLLSVISTLLLSALVILFAWSNVMSLFNRSPPPIPHLQVSEQTVQNIADILQVKISKSLMYLRTVALGQDVKLFLKVGLSLWIISVVGGWFDLLTITYIGIVIAHTLPFAYDKYENQINKYVILMLEEAKKQYRKIDELVLSKIPKASQKAKKTL